MARGSKQPTGQDPFSFGSTASGRASAVPGQGEAGAKRPDASAQVAGTLMAAPGQEEAGPDYGYRKKLFGGGRDEVSVYNEQMRERHAADKRVRIVVLLAVLVIVLVPVVLVMPTHLFGYGGFQSSMAQIGSGIAGRINAASQMFFGTAAGKVMAMYFWQIVAVAVAGAGLALNGAVYQGALKNALASPSTLGVMSGATLGTIIYTLFVMVPRQENMAAFVFASDIISELDAMGPWEYFVSMQARVLCSLAGSAVAVALVLAVAYMAGRGHVSKVGLLITGQVFAAVVTSLVEAIRNYVYYNGTEAQLESLRMIVSGGFTDIIDPYQVALLALPVLVGVVIVMALRNRLNLLAFSDDEAKTMGLSVNLTRNAVIAVCTVLTAIIVAFCGSVGFVGFLVPHLARMLVGPDFRYLVPASVLLGAAYLLVAFCLANMSGIFYGAVGMVTSIIGLVGFVVLAIHYRREGNVDWL